MTITRVQNAVKGSGASTSYTITLGYQPVVGDFLILVAGAWNANNATYSDIVNTGPTQTNATISWTLLAKKNYPYSTSYTVTCEIWIGIITASSGNSVITVTLNNTTSGFGACGDVCEYSGINNPTVDVTATNGGLTVNTTDYDTGSVATNVATELWVGGIEGTTNSSLTTPTKSFSLQDGTQGSGSGVLAYLEKIVSATGTADCGCSEGTNHLWAGCMVCLKAGVQNYTKTFTIDVVFEEYGIFKTDILDVVFQKLGITKPSSIDAALIKYGLTVTDSIDVIIEKLGITMTDSVDIFLKKFNIPLTFTIDVVFEEYGIFKTDILDVVFQKLGITKPYSIDVDIIKYGIINTDSVDVILEKLGISKTDSIDVLFKKLGGVYAFYPLDVVFELKEGKTYGIDVEFALGGGGGYRGAPKYKAFIQLWGKVFTASGDLAYQREYDLPANADLGIDVTMERVLRLRGTIGYNATKIMTIHASGDIGTEMKETMIASGSFAYFVLSSPLMANGKIQTMKELYDIVDSI